MRRVVWSAEARRDFLDILGYVATDNPSAADRLTDRIEEAAANLGDFATGRRGRAEGTFEKVLPLLPYLIIYRITRADDGTEVVGIARVVHGARDWPPGDASDGR